MGVRMTDDQSSDASGEDPEITSVPGDALGDEEEKGPLRRCIASARVRPVEEMVRFAVAPDGTLVPDIEGRLPGRGIWLSAERDMVDKAVAKGLFARAARRGVSAAPDLAARVETLLARRCIELIGLTRRAGQAVAGFAKVEAALRGGKAALLLAASDAAAGGRDKLRALAPSLPLVAVLSGDELGSAFGREHMVHAMVAPGRLASLILIEAGRLSGFRSDELCEVEGKYDRAQRTGA